MKQSILFVCMALFMTSCNKTYYQIVDVKSANIQKENDHYVFNDGTCKVMYNFWSEGGNAGFTIENLSDEIVYVDLRNTFFIKNGMASDYFGSRCFSNGKSRQETNGKSVSAAAYGVWNVWPLDGLDGAISAQSSSFVSYGSNSNITVIEKPVVAIPPHSLKSFSEYKIMEDVIQDCSVNLMVFKNHPDGMTHTESDSPICFKNYITYRKGEKGEAKAVSNDFYVGGFTNYFAQDIMKAKKSGCKNTSIKSHCDKYAPDRFYVKYNGKHPNLYSADATNSSNSTDDFITVRKK